MAPEEHRPEYRYSVKIETPTGPSAIIPVAFLTSAEVQDFLQIRFKRLTQEAGIKGSRIHVERAKDWGIGVERERAADYEKVVSDVAACLAGSPWSSSKWTD
jgi:hypothetical protein